MQLNGFVKMHRKMVAWGWYQDNVVKGLFLHLLLTASFKDSQWMGRTLKAGQVVTSYNHLALDLGFSVQQIRTAIKKLNSTGEITSETTNKYTIITVANWEDYQSLDDLSTIKSTIKSTNEQQTINKQSTNNQQHLKNVKNVKNKRSNKDICSKFDSFWSAYPKKANKEKARTVFEKLKADDDLLQVILTAVENQKQSEQWKKDKGQFIPLPTTWLNGKRWEDEVEVKEKSELDEYF